MTAADYQDIGGQAAQEATEIEGRTEQILLRGIVAAAEAFDLMAPLPSMRPHGHDPAHSWEPAARRYRDIDEQEGRA